MRKTIFFGSLLLVLLMLLIPNISAVENDININYSTNTKIGVAIAIGKVKEFYENDTEYVINWIHRGAFIFQWDNNNGWYIGLNDNAGIVHYSKNDYTFIGVTNINFFIVIGFLHET